MDGKRWVVMVDGKQLEGDYSTDDVRNIVRKEAGKTILVWSQGMDQWKAAGEFPEFQSPAPSPKAPSPAAGPPLFEQMAAKKFMDKEEIRERAGVLRSLLDFRFDSLITIKIIPILYLIVMILIGLVGLIYFVAGGGGAILAGIRLKSVMSILAGLAIMILTPIVALVYLAFVRMWFEIVIVIFRIKDDLTHLTEKK